MNMDQDKELPPLWAPKLAWTKLNSTAWPQAIQWLTVNEAGDKSCIMSTTEALISATLVHDSSEIIINKKVDISEDDPILCFSSKYIPSLDVVRTVTAHKSTLLKLWKGTDLEFVASFKAQHLGPVILMETNHLSGLLYTASAGRDTSVKIWSLDSHQCLQAIRPIPARPTSLLPFNDDQDEDRELVAVANVEGGISVFTKGEATNKSISLNKHVSPVSSLTVAKKVLISAGRDMIIVIWDWRKGSALKVIPTFENVNCIKLLDTVAKTRLKLPPIRDDLILVGGQEGVMKVWNIKSGQEEKSSKLDSLVMKSLPINAIERLAEGSLVFVQEDVICTLDLTSKKIGKQFYSLNENEITDVIVVDKALIIASSSPILRAYFPETKALVVAQSPDEITMCLASCRNGTRRFCSAGRDNTITLWSLTESNELTVLTNLTGHNSSVKCVDLLENLIYSADQDGIIKVWQMNESFSTGSAVITKIGHAKEVTCIAVDVHKGLVMTGSLDKEAKLWNASDLNQVALLKGHRRGVVCGAFQPQDHVVITGSSDLTLKLWHTNTHDCLQTIEGAPGIPTRVLFMPKTLVYTTSTGNLVMLTLPSKDTTPMVLEAHQEQIWALAEHDSSIITAGKDCSLIVWKDNREAVEAELSRRKEMEVRFEQALANSISQGNLTKAVNLSLKLDKPRHTYQHLVLAHDEDRLTEVLQGVQVKHMGRLIDYASKWNTNTKQCFIAQHVQHFVFMNNLQEHAGANVNLQGMLLFNQKHYDRIKALSHKTAIVQNLLNNF